MFAKSVDFTNDLGVTWLESFEVKKEYLGGSGYM
jgi:hypothetical protein